MTRLPKFKTQREMGEFFDTHDSTEYFDEMPEEEELLKVVRPRKQQIAIRIDPSTLQKAKQIAKTKGVGYQTLMRMWITERVEAESEKAS